MTELLLGIFLSLLALVGFLFNVYIVLALVLTKQVQINSYRSKTIVIISCIPYNNVINNGKTESSSMNLQNYIPD